MHYPSYPFQQTEDTTQFFFESIGSKGVIQKTVAITATGIDNIYNLGLGDYNPETNEVDDLSVSDNGDTVKILATIFKIVHLYLNRYPERQLVFAGNTSSRNRLYRMAINKEIQELSHFFSLLGYWNDTWEHFDPKHHYDLFLIGNK